MTSYTSSSFQQTTSTTSQDLYSLLGLTNKNTTETDIKQAYKRSCFKYHPDKNIHNEEEAKQMFQLITDAFLILSDSNLRHVYDVHGMKGIDEYKEKEYNEGVSSGKHYDSKIIFDHFYSDDSNVNGSNPFGKMGLYDLPDFNSRKKQDVNENQDVLQMTSMKVKNDPEYKDLPCTLEELYLGAEKQIRVTRKRYLSDRKTCVNESKILRIKLEPVWKDGMQINMNNEGDGSEDTQPGDLIFTIKVIPHEQFQRDDENNLIVHANITLCEALTDCIVKITTLYGKTLIIPCPEIIHQNYERKLVGEGMPLGNDQYSKSDLIIRFNIEFPKVIKLETKRQLRSLLSAI